MNMDYAQRIKNLEEQLKYPTTNPYTVPNSKLLFENFCLQYGFSKSPYMSNEKVINCVFCKSGVMGHSSKIPASTNNTSTSYVNYCSCECIKEGIPVGIPSFVSGVLSRDLTQLTKQPVYMGVSYTHEDKIESLIGCARKWNMSMVALLTGAITPSVLAPELSNGLFGEPFKA